MFLLVLFCAAVSIAAEGSHQDVCKEIKNGLTADPFSCTSFYHCQNYKPVKKDCSPGKQYNLYSQKCRVAIGVCAFNPYNLGSCKNIFCLLESQENFRAADFDGRQCTHLLITDSIIEEMEKDQDLAQVMKDWKRANPTLKMMVNVLDRKTKQYLKEDPSRQQFILDKIKYARQHQFDGINYFFVWPHGSDKSRYTDFMKMSMELFENESRESTKTRLILSHVMDSPIRINTVYELDQVYKYVDFSLLYHADVWGTWFGLTGSHAPLDQMEEAVSFTLAAGHPPEKLIVSILYNGYSYKLSDPKNNGYGSRISGNGVSPIDGSPGIKFFQYCKLETLEGVTVVKDIKKGTYLYKDDFWLSYDDLEIIKAKIKFHVRHHLGGIALMYINYDDQLGTHCDKGENPLTKSIFSMCQSDEIKSACK